jgi:hypothetical protein
MVKYMDSIETFYGNGKLQQQQQQKKKHRNFPIWIHVLLSIK